MNDHIYTPLLLALLVILPAANSAEADELKMTLKHVAITITKSYSVQHALILYQTAFLKAHYPRELKPAVSVSKSDERRRN